jgi:hypothetical protein
LSSLFRPLTPNLPSALLLFAALHPQCCCSHSYHGRRPRRVQHV